MNSKENHIPEVSARLFGLDKKLTMLANLYKLKKQLTSTGICQIESGKYKYPISYQLIKDGRKNKIFLKKFKHKIHLTMFHGKKDEVVPVIFSKKILRIFKRAKKKLIIIKKGDHSLSSVRSLKMIQNELKRIVKNIS